MMCSMTGGSWGRTLPPLPPLRPSLPPSLPPLPALVCPWQRLAAASLFLIIPQSHARAPGRVRRTLRQPTAGPPACLPAFPEERPQYQCFVCNVRETRECMAGRSIPSFLEVGTRLLFPCDFSRPRLACNHSRGCGARGRPAPGFVIYLDEL